MHAHTGRAAVFAGVLGPEGGNATVVYTGRQLRFRAGYQVVYDIYGCVCGSEPVCM